MRAVKITPSTTLEDGYSRPFGATDGTRAFVIARFGSSENFKGLLVDPLTGLQATGTSPLLLSLATQEEVWGTGYDGNTFNVFSALGFDTGPTKTDPRGARAARAIAPRKTTAARKDLDGRHLDGIQPHLAEHRNQRMLHSPE